MSSRDPGEVSVSAAFAALFTDEAFHDVELEGTDGVRVAANRMALAARCKFFRSMLLGKFTEGSNKVVHVGFSGEVIRGVLQYIHTNTSGLLFKNIDSISHSTIEAMQSLLALEEAAAYFDLPGLHEKTRERLVRVLYEEPALAFCVLEAFHGGGMPVQTKSKNLAMATLADKGSMVATSTAVGLMSEGTMRKVLQNKTLKVTGQELFGFISKWANTDVPDGVSYPEEDRTPAAANFVAEHVKLEDIDPEVLSTLVASSGLVTNEQLAEAYKAQELMKAKKASDALLNTPQSTTVWEGFDSDVLSGPEEGGGRLVVLDYSSFPFLTSGIHQWTVSIEKVSHSKSIWLGVTQVAGAATSPLMTTYEYGWGFNSDGDFIWGGSDNIRSSEDDSAKFQQVGTLVTMTLNLSQSDPNNGSLHISINGKEPVLGTGNLRNELSAGGFRPAAQVDSGATIRIVNSYALEEMDAMSS